MNPADEIEKTFADYLRELQPRQLRNAIRNGVRRTAKSARKIAVRHLQASGLQVKGNRADFEKGLREFVFSPNRGCGFLLTVNARAGRRGTGAGQKGMHLNRHLQYKPVLMWAEEGTKDRRTGRGKSYSFYKRRKGHPTGRMPAYRFLERSEPEVIRHTKDSLLPDLEAAVDKAAKKAGLL